MKYGIFIFIGILILGILVYFFISDSEIDKIYENKSIKNNETQIKQCIENWNCSEWVPKKCPKSEKQTRTCLDLNKCNRTIHKPSEVTECIYIVEKKNCSRLNGNLCSKDEKCNGTYLDSIEKRCCNNNCFQEKSSCENIECNSNEKCIESKCIKKDCSDIGLDSCIEFNCYKSSNNINPNEKILYSAPNGDHCCYHELYTVGCAMGDLTGTSKEFKKITGYISGKGTVTYVYFKLESFNNFKIGDSEKYLEDIGYEFYVEEELYKGGVILNHNRNNALIYPNKTTSNVLVCEVDCLEEIKGKEYKLVLDPENKLKETNESNNEIIGIVP